MASLDVSMLTTIGSLATAAAVIIALIFGIVQVRLQAAQRRDLVAAEWWQLFVERMEEDPAPGKRKCTHVAFRGWCR